MRTARSKIQSRLSLKKKLTLARKKRRKIVFTNGCFDLLHSGHTTYLEKARAQGHLLVVAVNSDVSVRNLKGRGRPLHGLRERMKVIASLECVDYVTWFAEATPDKTIALLQPHVLVKGADYRESEIAGRNLVKSWGGRVKRIPLVKGRSTSRILQRIMR